MNSLRSFKQSGTHYNAVSSSYTMSDLHNIQPVGHMQLARAFSVLEMLQILDFG